MFVICVTGYSLYFIKWPIHFRVLYRPVILYREQDWEKEKKAYVDSVTRHIADNVEDGNISWSKQTSQLGLFLYSLIQDS